MKTTSFVPATQASETAGSFFAVEVREIGHTFPPARRGGEPREALADLSFSVGRGEIFGLLGPNGGGKTTLFRILSTALTPTRGQAQILGIDAAERPAEVREKIGVVFQHPSLDKKLSLSENLFHQGHLYGLHGETLARRIGELLERFRLTDRAGDRVEVLSGGLQRRVEIAKGLIHKPAVLLMDEPSTGLDPAARRDLWDYLSELKKEGMTILLTTHLMEEAEGCDRLALISRGRLAGLGTPEELKARIGGHVVAVQTRDPMALAEKIQAKFGCPALVLDRVVRIERPEGHSFVPQLVEAFPGLIESVTVGKPTLEDVFIRLTGRQFSTEDENQ